MPDVKEPITSATLELQFPSASFVVGADESYLVFPAIEFEKEDEPPKTSLNMDPDGPAVVRVDVHEIPVEEARRGYLGHSGLERVSLFLPPEPFADWVKQVRTLAAEQMGVVATVDDEGNVVRLSMNGREVVITLGSDTHNLGPAGAETPASRPRAQ